MEYIKNGDIISVVSEKIDLKEVYKRLTAIEKEIKELEKEPDVIEMPNDSKMFRLDELKREKEKLDVYKAVK